MDHVIGFATRGISTSIAVTSELVAGHRGKQSAEARSELRHRGDHKNETDEDEHQDLTERAWVLDEAAEESGNEDPIGEIDSEKRHADATVHEPAQQSQDMYHIESTRTEEVTIRPLPMAVVLPQRRPRDRSRGFIRAYAPVLGEYSDISQDTFIHFLNTWNIESRASPIFDVVNIACFGIGFIPNGIATAVSTAVGTVAMIAQELQGRYRTNHFLDRANDELFKPKGLVAMVMTYKPDLPDDLFLRADTTDPTTTALTKVLDMQSAPKLRQLIYKLRDASGTARGDSQVPEFAPLIYPSLDRALLSTTPAASASLVKRNAATVQDYFDRRAQADFAASNPQSRIAQALPPQQKPFVNRYCDPNHPVNNGSVFALVTGGKFDPIGAGRVRRAEGKARRRGEPPLSENERFDALMGRKVRDRVTGTPSKTIPVLGKLLKKDVLYLVIVNLPTAEEMQVVESSLKE